MTTRTLAMQAFSIRKIKPDYAYGQTRGVPLRSGWSAALLRAAIPADIPRNATILSAIIRVNIAGGPSWAGTTNLSVARNTSSLKSSVTWNNAPSYSSYASDVATVVDPTANIDVELDVTPRYNEFLQGIHKNYGLRVFSDRDDARWFNGAPAPYNPPELELVYAVPGEPPTDLSPAGGAVGTATPTVAFSAPDETISIQVQLDPAADSAAPDFDSGEVATTAGLLNLADTTYAPAWVGGEATFWRARYKHSELGWSDWSKWVTFSYEPLPTLTILTPDATPSDPTPTVSWSFGGTQTAWRTRIIDDRRRTLAGSGYRSGADTAWTPRKAFKSDGDIGTVEVWARDDVDRIAVPGFPTWVKAVLGVTVDLDATVPPMDALAATSDGINPEVVLTGTRSEIPDEVVIFRSGVRVARMPGTDVFTGTAFEWHDWTAPPNHQATYRVAPVTLGKVAKGGPTAVLTPRCTGLWLVDIDDDGIGTPAAIWGDDAGSWDRADVAALHQTLSGKYVRRRLGRPLLAGSVSGVLADGLGMLADDTIALLEQFAEEDAGHVFRLVAGDLNMAVNIGDVTPFPTPASGQERVSAASLSFWEVDD